MRNEKYVLVYYIDEIAECVEYARKIANKYSWKVAMMTNTAKNSQELILIYHLWTS